MSAYCPHGMVVGRCARGCRVVWAAGQWVGYERGGDQKRPAQRTDRSPESTEADASCRNIDHISAPWCWCQPVTSWEDPTTGERVYLHRKVSA